MNISQSTRDTIKHAIISILATTALAFLQALISFIKGQDISLAMSGVKMSANALSAISHLAQ